MRKVPDSFKRFSGGRWWKNIARDQLPVLVNTSCGSARPRIRQASKAPNSVGEHMHVRVQSDMKSHIGRSWKAIASLDRQYRSGWTRDLSHCRAVSMWRFWGGFKGGSPSYLLSVFWRRDFAASGWAFSKVWYMENDWINPMIPATVMVTLSTTSVLLKRNTRLEEEEEEDLPGWWSLSTVFCSQNLQPKDLW